MLRKMLKNAEKAVYAEGYITVFGRREVSVENCRRVYECNEIMTRIKTADGIVTVWGEGLETSSYFDTTVKITGRISSIEFEEMREAGDD